MPCISILSRLPFAHCRFHCPRRSLSRRPAPLGRSPKPPSRIIRVVGSRRQSSKRVPKRSQRHAQRPIRSLLTPRRVLTANSARCLRIARSPCGDQRPGARPAVPAAQHASAEVQITKTRRTVHGSLHSTQAGDANGLDVQHPAGVAGVALEQRVDIRGKSIGITLGIELTDAPGTAVNAPVVSGAV